MFIYLSKSGINMKVKMKFVAFLQGQQKFGVFAFP